MDEMQFDKFIVTRDRVTNHAAIRVPHIVLNGTTIQKMRKTRGNIGYGDSNRHYTYFYFSCTRFAYDAIMTILKD